MIINGKGLLQAAPIKNMLTTKERAHGVSHGLAEIGYDIRLKQTVVFTFRDPRTWGERILDWLGVRFPQTVVFDPQDMDTLVAYEGHFCIASAIEEFNMPTNLGGVVHDKSTWIRRGLQVFNTVIEPGWHGFLTLEMAYHGRDSLSIPAGAGIAQVLFHSTAEHAQYDGKYQNQADKPVEAKAS